MLKTLLAALGAGVACFLYFYLLGQEVPVLVERGLFAAAVVFIVSLAILLPLRIARWKSQRKAMLSETPFQAPQIITLRSKTPEQLEEERQRRSLPRPRHNPFTTRH